MNMKVVAELSSKISFIMFIGVFLDEYICKGGISEYIDKLYTFYKNKED